MSRPSILFHDAETRGSDGSEPRRRNHRQVLDAAPVSLGILYGSYARGETTPHSDIDLAVEFEDSLSSVELTRARLGLIEKLVTELGTNEIDVVPLSRVHGELLQEILADGVLIHGSPKALEQYQQQSVEVTNRRDRIEEFDSLLTELERVV